MRIIDANKFRRFVHEQLEMFETYSADKILEMIDEQPTAYDLDKVVRELEDMKLVRVEQCHEDYEIEVMTESNFDDAIEIVKRGVINE